MVEGGKIRLIDDGSEFFLNDALGVSDKFGLGGVDELVALVAAWRLTGDESYREAALLGLDYLHGANGLGRVNTTGLGDHATTVDFEAPGTSPFGAAPSDDRYGLSAAGDRLMKRFIMGSLWPLARAT